MGNRRIALESYLLMMSSLISGIKVLCRLINSPGTSLMIPMLDILGLSPRSIPEKMEAQQKSRKPEFIAE